MIKNELCTVVSHAEIAENIMELTLRGELVHEMDEPGRFVHIKVGDTFEPLLRRPISICRIDQKNLTFTMIYRKEGRGTQLLAAKKEGELVDVLGPLGNGFPVEEAKSQETALLVGGGIGVPPLYELAHRLTASGVKVITVLGFQTRDVVFYEEKFRDLGDTYVATVDGTHGTRGFVTDVIAQERLDFDILYSCGPTAMLRNLEKSFPKKRVFISLEERMGCGIGACFACVCHTQEDPTGFTYKKVCTDGPVFKAGEVVI
ncbi:dihydroorotate dehydrogenase electron transfer subunit [Niallia nealsonii]|uniref:Dihydroorotate dehydrogenase B (NAD(+)), electron transfer subunit n=1 Tax=Niallia nealsonii TaxID=115979 RepID=A0A2N0Z6U1_9BACI|nr:dihydroorotate dehydrogenase electron transfer subunit [Niallia nealsonii]PKG25231.1 dihydroorotate dehydrogenase electron transfer subunit [Niallia nealsonii]